ncbi:MAG TPA: hypothetical protein VEQ41_01550 [Solirubrobacterales bacterium]|nr:hypothetical protein [Solirubrobacterales bacterium]
MRTAFDTRPPRGALIVIAVGLLATAVAALASTDKSGGSWVEVEWAAKSALPDSRPARIPGGGSMRLRDAGLRVTEDNINGERVFRLAAILEIDARSAVGQARVGCTMRGGGAELARTGDNRGAFPRSTSEESLTKQEVPDRVGLKFHISGGEYASLELADAFDAYTNLPGVVGTWEEHRDDAMGWQWGMPKGRPAQPVTLGFSSFWKTTTKPPAGSVSCTVENAIGAAAVRTTGSLG